MSIFDNDHQKVIKVTFSFPKFVSQSKKIRLFYYFLFTQPILESCDQSGHTQFLATLTKKKKILKKSGSVKHNFIRVSNTMPKLKAKLLIKFQENVLK